MTAARKSSWRSNGTVTYVGKDIANQFWKYGLLGRDFHYRVFEERGGRHIWATSSHDCQGNGRSRVRARRRGVQRD
jgi:hypothetical protein